MKVTYLHSNLCRGFEALGQRGHGHRKRRIGGWQLFCQMVLKNRPPCKIHPYVAILYIIHLIHTLELATLRGRNKPPRGGPSEPITEYIHVEGAILSHDVAKFECEVSKIYRVNQN